MVLVLAAKRYAFSHSLPNNPTQLQNGQLTIGIRVNIKQNKLLASAHIPTNGLLPTKLGCLFPIKWRLRTFSGKQIGLILSRFKTLRDHENQKYYRISIPLNVASCFNTIMAISFIKRRWSYSWCGILRAISMSSCLPSVNELEKIYECEYINTHKILLFKIFTGCRIPLSARKFLKKKKHLKKLAQSI